MNKLNIDRFHAISGSGKNFEFLLPLTDKVTINGIEYDIELKFEEETGLYIVWNGKKYPAEIIRSRQNKYEILFNNIGYSFTIETPFSLRRMKVLEATKPAAGPKTVKAPMPGKIVDVFCQKGTIVAKGETLLILEAMKMENEILSPINGTVVSVYVQKENTVMKDDLLIEIEQKKG